MANPLLKLARVSQKPQEQPSEPSILRRIGNAVLSPLAMVGNVLDLPGSSVRDVLTGKNPLDQWASKWWEDTGNRSSGRDVLTAAGLAKPNDPQRWELADIGGFLTEVATDPLTFVSGIGSGAGKALRGTGQASHLFNVGLPLTKQAVPVGKGAAQLLDKAAGKAWGTQTGDFLGRLGSGLFDPAVKGMFGKEEQAVARRMTDSAASTASEASLKALDDIEAMRPIKEGFDQEFKGLAPSEWQRVLQHSQELANDGDFAGAFSKAVKRVTGNDPSPALVAQAGPALEAWNAGRRELRDAVWERGGKVGEISGKVAHAPRAINKEYAEFKKQNLSGGGFASSPHMKSRRELIATIPEDDIRKMLSDRERYGGKTGALNIRQDFPEYMGYTNSKGEVVNDIVHSNQLRKWINSVPADMKAVHELAPEALHVGYRESMDKVARDLDAIHTTLHEAIDPNGVGIQRVFRGLGMDSDRAADWFAKTFNMPINDVLQLKINRGTAKAIQNVMQASKNPEWFGVLGEMVDKFNRAFKGAVTLPFPGFHLRNLISGQHMNLASKHLKSAGDYSDYGKAVREAWKIRGEGTKSAVYREAVAAGMAPNKRSLDDAELLGGENPMSPIFNPIEAGRAAVSQAGEYVSENSEGTWLFGADRLLGNRGRQIANTPMQYGSNVARTTEFMNRVPMYLYLKKKGLSAKEAAAEVNKLQFDYANSMAPFEKQVMRRMVPFWGFTRNVTPQILSMLLEQPGGKMAQTIRAASSAQGEGDVLPAHVADTTAIPLGTRDDGTKSYLAGFGLTPEAAAPYLTAPADPGGAGMQGLAALTPLVKGPLELATGQSFFQRGRKLSELDPSVGRTISNWIGKEDPVNILGDRGASRLAEHALANSPLSRFITTARSLSDPRKTLGERANNLLLPTRITDVSPQQQERLLQQAASELADHYGARTWTNKYFPKDLIERAKKVNPELARQMDDLNTLLKSARKQAGKYRKPAPKE